MIPLTNFVRNYRHNYLPSLFLIMLAAEVAPMRAQPSSLSFTAEHAAVDLEHAVNVIGLGDLRQGTSGHLILNEDKLSFVAGNSKAEIPTRFIRAFSMSRGNVALIGGTKGAIVGMAPFGVGPLTSAIRPGSDMLTLVYLDEYNAVHGSVLLLPKGKGNDVTQALSRVGLTPSDYLQRGPIPIEGSGKDSLRKDIESARDKPTVQVALFTTSFDGIPAEFPLGAYEELIVQLRNSKIFKSVWRQGDDRTDSIALTLRVNIRELHKGSARARSLIPFTGATVAKVDVRLTDASGKVLVDQQMTASKRLRGESISVTKGLAKRIRDELIKLPNWENSPDWKKTSVEEARN